MVIMTLLTTKWFCGSNGMLQRNNIVTVEIAKLAANDEMLGEKKYYKA